MASDFSVPWQCLSKRTVAEPNLQTRVCKRRRTVLERSAHSPAHSSICVLQTTARKLGT
jgi:hypothetical protein